MLWEEAQAFQIPPHCKNKSPWPSSSFHKQQERAAIIHGTKHPLQLRVENSPGCRAPGLGAPEARGLGTHTASQTLPPWLCQPHTLLSMDAAPPSRQHQVFQLCPQQRGNAEGYTLLQELSSPGDTQLILRPSRQAREQAWTPKAPKSMSRQGVFPHGPGFLQCPALPPTSAHSSHKSKHPQGAPGKPSTPVTGVVYELMFQRFFGESWPRDCQRFCSSPGLKYSPNLAQPHALLLALT